VIPANHLVPIPVAADLKVMGNLPRTFEGDRDKSKAFMNDFLLYVATNQGVAGFESPLRRIALILTLIKGPRVDRWVGDMTTWLRGRDPVNDNVEAAWDHFAHEFEEQFRDHTQTQRARQQLDHLKFKFPEIDQYVSEFEDLASMAGYTVGNEETVNLFLKGFENAPDVLSIVLGPPLVHTYYDIKERAIAATRSRQLMNAIKRKTFGTFGAFRPPQNRPFFQRTGTAPPPRPQFNSSNAPRTWNNVPVPMDTSARSRAPNRGRWTNARAATANDPPRKKGACFNCGIEGHFARECRKTTKTNRAVAEADFWEQYNQEQDTELRTLQMQQPPLTPDNILDNALQMFDQLPDAQKNAFIHKYEGGREDFPDA
jgi:hypothetical protein